MSHPTRTSPLGEDLTRWLFQESQDGLILFEPQTLEVIEVNKSAEIMMAQAASDLLENPIDTFILKTTEFDQFVNSCRETGSGRIHELFMQRPDRTVARVSSEVRFIRTDSGSQGLLRLRAVEPADEHRVITDSEGSPSRLRVQNESDVLGVPYLQGVDESDRSRVARALLQALDGQAVAFESCAVVNNGQRIVSSSSLMPVLNSLGAVTKLIGVTQGITQRMETEQQLRESEQRFRTIFEQAPVGFALMNTRTGEFVRVNRKYSEMLGYTTEEMLGMTFMEITAEGMQTDFANVHRLRDGQISEYTMETTLICKDGHRILVNLTVAATWNPKEEPGFYIAIVEDISGRKRMERALQESQNSLARAQEIAHLGNWELDFESGTVVGSAETYRMLGIAEEEAGVHHLAMAIEDHIHPDDRDEILELVEAALAHGEPKPHEFRHVSTRSGEVRYLRAEAQMTHNADGSLAGMFGTLQDITERKQVEIALRESENKFRVIAESCPAMVAIFLVGKIEYANQRVSSILEYSNDELLKMDFIDFVDAEHRELVQDRNQRRMRGEVVPERYEFKLRTKSGKTCWIDFTASSIEFNGKLAVLGIALDITERRMTEERLYQREAELAHVSRLTTMGEMVAGIAHEINQPLSAIANFSDACVIELEKLNDPKVARIQQWSQLIGQQAIRCGDIIRRLRSYVKRKQLDDTDVSVNELVHESIALLRNEFRKSLIDVNYESVDPQLTVIGNQVELQQVLVNLLANARDAMKQSDQRQRKLTISSNVSDNLVRICVEDNGPGIRPDQLDHLFEAFFTTKSVGMGMGLAISRSILERHKGRLWAENRRPHGAAFHLELPLT